MTELGPHDLTSYTSHSPYVVSASSEYAGFSPAWKAFDGVVGLYTDTWLGTGAGVDWLKIDLGSAHVCAGYAIAVDTQSGGEPARAPKIWTFQGSNDNSSWTTLDTQSSQTSWGSGERRTFACAPLTTAYRYFRVNITANNGDATYTQISELYLFADTTTANEIGPHNCVSDTSHSPFVISASSAFLSSNPEWFAFDNDTRGSSWITNAVPTGWLKIDLGSGVAKILKSYSVQATDTARAPKNWTMEGSNDNSSWTAVDTRTGETGWGAPETRNYICATATTAYRYFRINVTLNNGDSTYLQIGEMYLFGLPAVPPQRGNIDYDQIRGSARQGSGPLFQMYAGGASPVSGGIPAWDANGNLAISSLNQSTIVTDPTSTKGDLIVRGASSLGRLGVGTDGWALTADSTQPSGVRWASVSSGGGSVTSVFTRTGAVIAVSGDYTAAQVTNAVDKTQTYSDPAWITSLAWSKVSGAPSFMADPTTTKGDLIVHGTTTTRLPVGTDAYALVADSSQTLGIKWAPVVSSFAGRSGAVIGQSGDYTAAMVTNAVSTLGSYTDPAWILSLSWSKIASPPNFIVDPTAIKGDLIVRGSASVPTRIGIGSDGQVLIADSSQTLGMRWGAASGSGSQTPWTQDIQGAGYQLLNTGHVGIGTGSPRGMLEVATNAITDTYRGIVDAQYYGGVQGAAFWQLKGRGTLASPAAIQAGDYLGNLTHLGVTSGGSIVDGAQIFSVVTSVGTGTVAADLVFLTNSGTSASTERMRITGSGNVGIGGSPAAALHVYRASGGAQIVCESGGTTDTYVNVKDANRSKILGINPASVGAGVFSIYDATAFRSDITIATSGNVGLGNLNSPQFPLQVQVASDKTIGLRNLTSGNEICSVNASNSAFQPLVLDGAPLKFNGVSGTLGIIHYLGTSAAFDGNLDANGTMYMYVGASQIMIRFKDGIGNVKTVTLTGS